MHKGNHEPLLPTERQAARALSVSPRTVWHLADRRKLPVVWTATYRRISA